MNDHDLSDADYIALASFRRELRRFLRFSEHAARQAGLSAAQYQALLAIRGTPAGEMLVGELAEQLLLRPHSATELADRLEALGLIERAPAADDRRQVRLALTPKAITLLASLVSSHRLELQRIRPLLTGLMQRL